MSILANNKVADGQFVRTNGWTRPLNKYQIATWIALFLFSLISWSVEVVALHRNAWPATYAVTGVLMAGIAILIIITTGIDPSDDNSLEYRKRTKKGAAIFDRSKHKHVIEGGFCNVCRVNVMEASKHCQPCNKCVKEFDHHCMWLNNCVGSKNYGLFFALLAVTLTGTTAMLGIGLYVFFNGIFNPHLLNPDIWWWKLPGGFVGFQVLIGIKICVAIVIAGFLIQLTAFHIKLIYRNQTTYVHFKRKEEKKERKKKLQLQEKERKLNFNDMPVPACSERQSEVVTIDETVGGAVDLKEGKEAPKTFSNINHSYTDEIV